MDLVVAVLHEGTATDIGVTGPAAADVGESSVVPALRPGGRDRAAGHGESAGGLAVDAAGACGEAEDDIAVVGDRAAVVLDVAVRPVVDADQTRVSGARAAVQQRACCEPDDAGRTVLAPDIEAADRSRSGVREGDDAATGTPHIEGRLVGALSQIRSG
ncbi:MAG: hypothetical protein BWY57_02383 [Betaproteobacteria bacterium ADurb.Bin341]|nr:MAG: hypothetical protein BWY57_02383 [Betaproteobacteria bacterium ADurb.Bin341]